jgi:AmmeMemoRadiSam system protein B
LIFFSLKNRLRGAAVFFLILSAFLLLCGRVDAASLISPFERKTERAVELYSCQSDICPKVPARVLGGITPHHDLALAMIVRFYERVSSGEVKRVWLFSPDHFRRARRLAALCDGDWALSGGTLEADGDACGALASLRIVEANSAIFAAEHGITLHIPLIARYFPNAAVVPILLNPEISDMGLIILKNKISELLREDDIVILSMDLSHYKTPEEMAAEDIKTLDVLKNLRFTAAHTIDADARRAASLVMRLFKDLGAERGLVLERSDSSDFLGRRVESGTSYATVVYEKTKTGEEITQ